MKTILFMILLYGHGASSTPIHMKFDELPYENEIFKTFNVNSIARKIVGGDGDTCSTCDMVIRMFRAMVVDNTTKEEIVTYLKGACYMAEEAEELCSYFINAHALNLLNDIAKYLTNSLKICTQFKLCNGASQQDILPLPDNTHNSFLASGKDVIFIRNNVDTRKCQMCEFIVSIIQDILEDQPMQDFFHDLAKKMCDYLPVVRRKECIVLIDRYEPVQFLHFVKTYLNPMYFCPDVLGVC